MSYILKPASAEQLEVINLLKLYNVVVNSVAGSGKTTTTLHVALTFRKINILLLTYNAKLKLETREKVNQLGITNLKVHSYHSFCKNYYIDVCKDDNGIASCYASPPKDGKKFGFQLIILDEAQDISPLYYGLIFKIISDNGIRPRLCVVGDQYQSIFEFNEADSRFITLGHQLFNVNSREWKFTKLSTSFRMTKENADFINEAILGEKRMLTIKSGEKPRYIIYHKYFNISMLCSEVLDYLENYKPEDIFILAPSVKTKTMPIRKVANKLSNMGIKIFVPNSDEQKLDEDILAGKIVCSTFHQSKGLERKVVIIFSFDDSLFAMYKRNADPTIPPNEIYVALTRASERLTLLHCCDFDYFPFINQAKIYTYCNVFKYREITPKFNDKPNNNNFSITKLIRFLPYGVINRAADYFKVNQIQPPSEKIAICSKTQQGNFFEDVSDINGVAIPAYYEECLTGKMTISISVSCPAKINFTKTSSSEIIEYPVQPAFNSSEWNIDSDEISPTATYSKLPNHTQKNKKISKLLELANNYCAYISGYIFKVNQISNYNWLEMEQLELAASRLRKIIPNPATRFEIPVECKVLEGKGLLTGYMDCIYDNKVYEFKCVAELSKEHFIQLACYAYANETQKRTEEKDRVEKEFLLDLEKHSIPINRYYLYNILSDEMYELYFHMEDLEEMVNYLIHAKMDLVKKEEDEKFLQTMTKRVKHFLT